MFSFVFAGNEDEVKSTAEFGSTVVSTDWKAVSAASSKVVDSEFVSAVNNSAMVDISFVFSRNDVVNFSELKWSVDIITLGVVWLSCVVT